MLVHRPYRTIIKIKLNIVIHNRIKTHQGMKIYKCCTGILSLRGTQDRRAAVQLSTSCSCRRRTCTALVHPLSAVVGAAHARDFAVFFLVKLVIVSELTRKNTQVCYYSSYHLQQQASDTRPPASMNNNNIP